MLLESGFTHGKKNNYIYSWRHSAGTSSHVMCHTTNLDSPSTAINLPTPSPFETGPSYLLVESNPRSQSEEIVETRQRPRRHERDATTQVDTSEKKGRPPPSKQTMTVPLGLIWTGPWLPTHPPKGYRGVNPLSEINKIVCSIFWADLPPPEGKGWPLSFAKSIVLSVRIELIFYPFGLKLSSLSAKSTRRIGLRASPICYLPPLWREGRGDQEVNNISVSIKVIQVFTTI